MLLEYVNNAMKKAKYEILSDDNTYYGCIPGFKGVWANAINLENCRHELIETLEEWLLVRLRKNLKIPKIKGIDLKIKEVA